MRVRCGSATDVGRRRSTNQDALVADLGLRLFVVADGMGGHAGGEIASRLIVDRIHGFMVDTAVDDKKTWPFEFDLQLSYPANRLKTSVLVANRKISESVARGEGPSGMGATLAAALLGPDRVVIANVGDCRTYLLRDGVLQQLTRDHSWVAEQVASGFITEETARAHPWRSYVTRAIQGESDLLVDTVETPVIRGDRLLLCSDGLHVVLTDDDINAILSRLPDAPEPTCASLIDAANERDAPDNVSVIVIDVVGDEPE